MRSSNQNKRSRGRNNGNRKHSNPLSRNYESNGPDVKIRGNASHIAEKYLQLARDAQASGDSVMAENYLQHAEHYFRIISAAQAQNAQRQEQNSANFDHSSNNDEDDDDDSGDDNGQRSDSRMNSSDDAAGEPQPAASNAAEQGEDEKPAEERKKPQRRPRRRRQSEDAESGAQAGAGDASQELPAFLTNGQTTAAE